MTEPGMKQKGVLRPDTREPRGGRTPKSRWGGGGYMPAPERKEGG